ncbi:unnamed protein product [Staurois parvus]|uniref:Uncharacterized protein n=1 Tax=Staurois parvus TaxID=386267 RepID=A0ABN9FS77_9NEOB|nr:unnamed protein product [Staurois parvus]
MSHVHIDVYSCLQAVEFTVVFFKRRKLALRSRFYQHFKLQMLVNMSNCV